MAIDTPIKNILFPTDFSKLSGNALITAIAMCNRHNATLHLLHVVDNRYFIVPHEAHNAALYLMPDLEKSGIAALEELSNKIKAKHDINLKTHLESGSPAIAIGNKAIELDCELIVMGTHGASGLREFFIGSNAYAVIKNTPVPVLTVPGKKGVKGFKKILFPIRAVKNIKDKYDFITSIIEKNASELVVIGLALPGEENNLSIDYEMKELQNSLQAHNTKFKADFFVCKNYAKKVLEVAKKEKVNLIVINASLDYEWRQFFVGPYTQQIVNHATVPVLSVRTLESPSEFETSIREEIENIRHMKLSF